MKKLFRPIRELLTESMGEAQEVETLEDVYNLIKDNGHEPFEKEDIVFKFQCFDKRINWHSYLLVVHGNVAGYTNFDFSEKNITNSFRRRK